MGHRVCATKEADPRKEGNMTTDCQVVSFLLATYATDDVLTVLKANVANFKQLEGMPVIRYSEVLWENALRCGLVYRESRRKGVFINGLHKSTHFAMRVYWGAHEDETLQSLERHETSMSNIENYNRSSITCSNKYDDTRGRHKQLTTHTRRGKVTSVMSREQRRGSFSSSSTSRGKEFKCSEQRKSRISSQSRKRSSRLDHGLVLNQFPQATPYSNPF